jgi:hypothetical protein
VGFWCALQKNEVRTRPVSEREAVAPGDRQVCLTHFFSAVKRAAPGRTYQRIAASDTRFVQPVCRRGRDGSGICLPCSKLSCIKIARSRAVRDRCPSPNLRSSSPFHLCTGLDSSLPTPAPQLNGRHPFSLSRHRARFSSNGTVPPFNRLLRGNDVMCVAINPQRHITGSELSSAFGA